MIRQCGDCQLCCKLLPVPPLEKKAGQRCRHQKFGKGCAVYHKAGMPMECSIWNCRWLVNDDTADLPRPDRSHYVIDITPDHITLQDNETKATTAIQVVQIWIDPKHPLAHRDPALRAYLLRRGEQGIAALVRYDNRHGCDRLPAQHDRRRHPTGRLAAARWMDRGPVQLSQRQSGARPFAGGNDQGAGWRSKGGDRMTTWREGVEHWRAWGREGGSIDPKDAERVADFYEALARHGGGGRGNLDDEMPPELGEQFMSRAR